MNPRPEVVGELRALFRDGATPSRLIGHVVERHAGERGHHALIQAYFAEAFGVPIVRGLDPTDDYRHDDLRYAFLNEQLVHAMIQTRGEWDAGSGAASWLDPLVAEDDRQRLDRGRAAAVPELSRCWHELTPKEQQFVQRSLATANGLYESVRILSRLAERLQQQLVEIHAAASGSGHG